jgi:hypothetical protein
MYLNDCHRVKCSIDRFLYLQFFPPVTVPFLAVVVLSHHSILLGEHSFLVMQHCAILQVLPVLVSKLGWLSLLHIVFFEVEPRLNPQFDGVELAHLLLLVL